MIINRLIYTSRLSVNFTNVSFIEQLNNILTVSARHNQADDITGALIFDRNWFVQVLEGSRDKVWSLFKKIEQDSRHTDVIPHDISMVAGRRFGQWWMGCAERNSGNEQVFARYLREGEFEPDKMPTIELLSLMIELSEHGLRRAAVAMPALPL